LLADGVHLHPYPGNKLNNVWAAGERHQQAIAQPPLFLVKIPQTFAGVNVDRSPLIPVRIDMTFEYVIEIEVTYSRSMTNYIRPTMGGIPYGVPQARERFNYDPRSTKAMGGYQENPDLAVM
jgi:hypothetical protein